MEKWQAHKQKQWHKNNHIWVTDGKNVLVQLRSKEKRVFPNKWDISAAGHFQAGETPLDGAKREWKEELGINWEFGDIKEKCIVTMDESNIGSPVYEHMYLYFLKTNIDLSKLKLQKKEVADIKWFSFDEFKKLFESKDFVPYPDYYRKTVIDELSKLTTNIKGY